MRVRKLLTPLVREDLKRLCRRRELRMSGTRDEFLRRLAYSYRGDLATLVLDLRQRDLLKIAAAYSDHVEFPAGLPGAAGLAVARSLSGRLRGAVPGS